MLRLAIALVLLLPGPIMRTAEAQEVRPIYHGELDTVHSVNGKVTDLDPVTGNLTVRGWFFLPADGSNGIFPGQEEVIIALGTNKFTIPRGLVRPNAKSTRFSYRAQMAPGSSGIRSVRIVRKNSGPFRGWYSIQFQLRGLDLRDLYDQDPVCFSMAFIVGDDDGFKGVELTRKSFQSKRLRSNSVDCSTDTSWPWLGG